jgi:hypothetical protein
LKKIIAACIDRLIEFDSSEEAATYVEGLREKKSDVVIVKCEEIGGKYRLRVKEQYNKNPLLK